MSYISLEIFLDENLQCDAQSLVLTSLIRNARGCCLATQSLCLLVCSNGFPKFGRIIRRFQVNFQCFLLVLIVFQYLVVPCNPYWDAIDCGNLQIYSWRV